MIYNSSDLEMESLVKLVDSNQEDVKGDKSGILLYNNKTVCADRFTTTLSVAMCRLLGYLNTRRWKARKNEGSYEINGGRLTCSSHGSDGCILEDYNECRTGLIVFLHCTG